MQRPNAKPDHLNKGDSVLQANLPPLNGANRFAHIDAMRAFAVLLVVVAHAGLGGIVPGGSGVTIFFSISGFIITFLLLRERDKSGGFSARQFYFRRSVKIAPPFLLIIVLPSLVGVTLGRIDVLALLSQVFFVFNWVYVNGSPEVLDGSDVVWSLAIEEQFYILFAVVWLVVARTSAWRYALILIAAAAVLYSTILRVVLAADPSLSDRIYYGSDTRMDGIAWGVLAAVAFHWMQSKELLSSQLGRQLAHDRIFVCAIAIYVFSLVYRDETFRDTFRYSLQSLAACAVILYGLLPGEGLIRRMFYHISQLRIVALIGLASYSIYLVHLVVMNPLRSSLNFPAPANVLILSIIGVGAGIVVYRFIEMPVHGWSQKRRSRSVLAPE